MIISIEAITWEPPSVLPKRLPVSIATKRCTGTFDTSEGCWIRPAPTMLLNERTEG